MHPVGVHHGGQLDVAHAPLVDQDRVVTVRDLPDPPLNTANRPRMEANTPVVPGSKRVNITTCAPLADSRATAASYRAARASRSTLGF